MTKKILVIDDDPGIRVLFHELLKEAGYEVALAEDGLEAVAMLKKSVPDLIILDVMMPVINGPRLIEVIRADPRPEMWQVPIVVCSAEQIIDEIIDSRDHNISPDDCLSKPFTTQAVLDLIERKLAMSEPA